MTEAANTSVREDVDRTLYWTLSLYIDAHNLPADFAATLAPGRQTIVQSAMFGSIELRAAIEPMFNDIADRERVGVVGGRRGIVEDYLLDVRGDAAGQSVAVHMPESVVWTTEGKTFIAQLGPQPPRRLRYRSFWYVHASGALSYTISFSLNYAHTIDDFFFLLLLQKSAAPKEFAADDPFMPDRSPRQIRVTQARAGLFALDALTMETDGKAIPIWHFVAARFNADAADLFACVLPPGRKTHDVVASGARKSYFEELITLDDFIELPGLKMPRARFMFMFDDRTFLGMLLPRDADGAMETRRARVKTDEFAAYPRAVKTRRAAAQGRSPVMLERAFFDAIAPEHLRYLFLAGFAQNIIDFCNQEAHEVLDSLDPIYPTNEEQEAESFFVRYANPRGMTTFTSQLRSLDLGNNYIGTCPYAFLVHVLAMHNEFIVRDYEFEAERLMAAVQDAGERDAYKAAAQHFYDFHKREYSHYHRHRANNVFRYDTEQAVFEALEKRRGIAKRVEDVERTVSNVEKLTRDYEERQRKADAELFGWILGVFSLSSFAFTIVEKLAGMRAPEIDFRRAPSDWIRWHSGADAWNALVVAAVGAAAVAGVYFFARWIGRGRLGAPPR